jgi:hypothetical protein
VRLESPDGYIVRLVDGNETVVLVTDRSGNVTIPGSLAVTGSFVEGGHLEDSSFVTPVNAVAGTATVTYTHGSQPTAAKVLTVNGKAYKFVAGPVAAEGDVLIGADEDATMLNLARAINRSGGTPDTDYKVSAAHPTVAATAPAAHVVALAARTAGAAGNALTLTTDETTFTLDDFATLATGVDGTAGAKGDIRFDTGAVYFCTAANTISGANWKKATLSTF